MASSPRKSAESLIFRPFLARYRSSSMGEWVSTACSLCLDSKYAESSLSQPKALPFVRSVEHETAPGTIERAAFIDLLLPSSPRSSAAKPLVPSGARGFYLKLPRLSTTPTNRFSRLAPRFCSLTRTLSSGPVLVAFPPLSSLSSNLHKLDMQALNRSRSHPWPIIK